MSERVGEMKALEQFAAFRKTFPQGSKFRFGQGRRRWFLLRGHEFSHARNKGIDPFTEACKPQVLALPVQQLRASSNGRNLQFGQALRDAFPRGAFGNFIELGAGRLRREPAVPSRVNSEDSGNKPWE